MQRHLARVEERLPRDAGSFAPSTDASDAVILHLWQAVQIVIDLARIHRAARERPDDLRTSLDALSRLVRR